MPSEAAAASAVAIIPARGGSKRIPRKNIRPFRGIPILVRTIGIIQRTGIFKQIVVSTDDEEVAELARAAGALVPFKRPAELSSDAATTIPVIVHALEELARSGSSYDYVCCIYPTAVLSRVSDYKEAWQRLAGSDLDYVFTATSFPFPIQRALRKVPGQRCEMMWPEYRETRSQDLEPAFHDAGQFYFGRRQAWIENRPLFGHRSSMLELPRYRVQDIDTEEDWKRAEMIFDLLEREDTDA